MEREGVGERRNVVMNVRWGVGGLEVWGVGVIVGWAETGW